MWAGVFSEGLIWWPGRGLLFVERKLGIALELVQLRWLLLAVLGRGERQIFLRLGRWFLGLELGSGFAIERLRASELLEDGKHAVFADLWADAFADLWAVGNGTLLLGFDTRLAVAVAVAEEAGAGLRDDLSWIGLVKATGWMGMGAKKKMGCQSPGTLLSIYLVACCRHWLVDDAVN